VGSLGACFVLVGEFLITLPLVLVVLPVWLLPWGPALSLARFYARVACTFWPSARRIAMINLRRAYGPDMTYDRAARLTRQIFVNLGQSLAEGLQFAGRARDAAAHKKPVRLIEDDQLVDRIVRDLRPKIYVTGHLGSWELALMVAGQRGRCGSGVIIRRVDNPFVNWLVRRVRLETSSQWIEKKGAVRECLARLEKGMNIGMLLDENGYWHGPFVEFFGRPAATQKTAAVLALETGAPIVINALIRSSEVGCFEQKLALIEPEQYRCRPDGVREITQEITRVLEGWIREDPGQWCWIHWRWKHRPDGSIESYTRRDLKECFS